MRQYLWTIAGVQSLPENTSPPSKGAGNSPGIGLLIAIVKGLQPLLFLLFAELGRVRDFEERWSKLH